MGAADRTEDRLADLQRRLEEIERRFAAADAEIEPRVPAVAETFWVLEGLRSLPDPVVIFAGRAELPGQRLIEWQLGAGSADLLDRAWTDLAPALAALGHPVRLQILQLVARGEAGTAAELARDPSLGSTGQIYHHLRQLVSAGWLQTRSRGRHAVPPERVVPLLVILSASA